MKELNAPWVHWEGSFDTPGADTLIENRELLGTVSNGIELEQRIVKPGNTRWNETRIDHLLARGDVAELLRPLFCPVEVNIASGSDRGVDADFFSDPRFGSGNFSMRRGDYANIIARKYIIP